MPTYQELIQQAEELRRQAEAVRKQEMQTKIEEIKAIMVEAGISAEDLMAALQKGRRSTSGASRRGEPRVIKYRGPDGEPWSGGPGRKPDWVRKILAAGGDIEQYRVAD